DELVYPGDRQAQLVGDVRQGHPLGRLDELAGHGDRFGHPTNLPCTSGYAPRQRGETKGSTVRIWKSVRAELNGAWRSVRYDLMRRSDPSRRDTDVLYPEYDAYTRAPRRGFAVAGMGLVVATGVAGTYFAVSGGLGSLLSTSPEPVPPALG